MAEPLLYLGRNVKANSGGYGKYRGGCGFETLRMVWGSQDWSMFFMGNGYMNSDWGLMGGYPSATGYRFEAHKTGLERRIANGEAIPLGADLDPTARIYEQSIDATAVVKRDNQCITTEECYANHDLYLNYLRGGPGFGDPLDRAAKSVESDLNQKFLLVEFARKVYGAVVSQDAKGVYHVDEAATKARRAEIRKERIARSVPTREWMKEERTRIVNKHASQAVQHMFATSLALSAKWTAKFRTFWDLPAEWEVLETELGVPSYGSKYRMDLSLMPDVRTVVQVEE
jgi:acetone carboxylase alpha subunit